MCAPYPSLIPAVSADAGLLRRARAARTESAEIDFKSEFDGRSWPEVIKDVVAMANSGGGALVFGVGDDGRTTHADLTFLGQLDSAAVTDQVRKYTGSAYGAIELYPITRRGGAPAVVMLVGAAVQPIVFEKLGNYAIADGKQGTAFRPGTIYVRHGTKSEPALNEDLRRMVDAVVDMTRKRWLADVARVVEAPQDAEWRPLRITQGDGGEDDVRIQLVDDPDAPMFGQLNPDATHPYRQTEVLERINERLPDGATVNRHDILCVRRCFDTDENPRFTWRPRFNSPQYSDHFVDWLISEHEKDQTVFATCRAEYNADRRGQTFQ